MNIDLIRQDLVLYLKSFEQRWNKSEKLKWYHVKQFQDNYDANASDFAGMLKAAINPSSMAGVTSPRNMLIKLAEDFPEDVKRLLSVLFNNSIVVDDRVKHYVFECKRLCKLANSEKKRNYPSSGQSTNSATDLLALMYPDLYSSYRLKLSKCVNDRYGLNVNIKNRDRDKVAKANGVTLTIRDALVKEAGFKEILGEKIRHDKNCYHDKNYILAAEDFIYFVQSKIIKNSHFIDKNLINNSLRYWWVNTSPSIFSFNSIKEGESKDFSIRNENGRKKGVANCFDNARVGDKVIAYEASPTLGIVALCSISAQNDGDKISIKLDKILSRVIPYQTLKEHPEISNSEAIRKIGSRVTLCEMSESEYNFIVELAKMSQTFAEDYTEDMFLDEVYISREDYNRLKELLEHKKNIVLQGPPGVGKTFAARRLAWSILKKKDNSRVEFVQFHQNYSYDDFVIGYRPTENSFELKNGIFYDFCLKANGDKGNKYFFIIDEINRGNLSKIFGELLMGIEKDYRGKESIKLPYNGLSISVPDNLYIIGLMNTADRSLALIDYALRRRFGFFNMKPGFDSDGFKKHAANASKKFLDVVEIIRHLNTEIDDDESLGEGFEIGHSYFTGEPNDDTTNLVVNYEILPTLKEYWFDDEDGKYDKWSKILIEAIK